MAEWSDRSFGRSVSRITQRRVNGRRPNIVEAWPRGDPWKWLIVVVAPDPDVDLASFFSISLTLGHGTFLRHIITHQGRHCSGLGGTDAVWVPLSCDDIWYSESAHFAMFSAITQLPWAWVPIVTLFHTTHKRCRQ